ncbi:hypothetical protein Acr_00g0027720 [Actinidia rufa]|uniref:Uncharacterized protein n=1 Tax=Actinidia rufa TaxID=165716 RepID=A0A7J0DFE1_9ERIC|nr:hypothetical protein Acr_00g0027720 [Actinidia rufa]
MSLRLEVANLEDLDSLPSWISDHLGEGSSYMTDEVNQSSESPLEGSPIPEVDPLVALHPSVEEKNNIRTLKELDLLRKSYSFPPGVQIKLPDEGETIVLARPGEEAFYKAAFPAGLQFPIHPNIRGGHWQEVAKRQSSQLGKAMDSPKGKEAAPVPEARKKMTKLVNVDPKASSSKPRESNSPSPSTVLGPTTSIIDSPFIVEKILRGAIPPANQEKKLFGELEPQLAEARAREQQAVDELAKMKFDHDSLTDKFERSGMLVVELKEAVDKARSSAIEEFKSSSDFLGQSKILPPSLDLDLLAGEDEAAEGEDEKKKGDASPPPF